MNNSDQFAGSPDPGDSHTIASLDRRSPGYVRAIMKMCGWKSEMTPRVLAAACELYRPPDLAVVLRECVSFFRNHAILVPDGLETIPPCWLRSLPAALWSTRKPHWNRLPYWMTHCAFEDGVLLMRFEQEGSGKSGTQNSLSRICSALINFKVDATSNQHDLT